ncbi:hypothetical protein JI57_02050 [Psychromonas sp. PRT-SC03]|nr:hypothetical protein JI57_02050 [Psychromonas sp. PRT-SC03]
MKLDVSLWTLSDNPMVEGFLAISNIHATNGDRIRMYGFGNTRSNLNYMEQNSLANSSPDNKDYGHWFKATNIDKGAPIAGDSGSVFINEEHYIVGVLRSTFQNTKECNNSYYCNDNSAFGNGFFDKETQTFVLNTINGWNAPNIIRNVTIDGKVLKIQSLHIDTLDILNTLSAKGDVNIDYSKIRCFTPDNHHEVIHGTTEVAPYDVCEIPLTSGGGEGTVILSNEQKVFVNPIKNTVEPPIQEGGGGSMGVQWLLGMLGMIFLRFKKINFNNNEV